MAVDLVSRAAAESLNSVVSGVAVGPWGVASDDNS